MKGVFGTLAISAALAAASPAFAATVVISEFSSANGDSYSPDIGMGASVRGENRDVYDAASALSNDNYFTLTLRAPSGQPINLSGLTFGVRPVSVYGTSGYFLRGSDDGFASDLASQAFLNDPGSFAPQTINFSSSYLTPNVASFRVYYYGVKKDTGIYFQNITFTGPDAVSAAPEPGTWAMMILGFGLVGFALRRRRNVTTRVAFAA